MFSHRSNSRSLPGAEKKSFIARLRPLFGRSKQITPDTPRSAYVIVQQPDRVSSSSAFHQFIPSLPSSPQFPLVDPRSWERNYAVVPIRECSTPGVPMNVASEFPPTSIVVQRSVYSTPNMGSPSTFLPPSPSSGFVGSPAEGAGHPPVSLGPPGLPPVAARPQTGSRQSTSHYVMSSRGHPANSSSTRLSRPSRLSQQVPPFGLQTIPPVLSTVEPSSYLAVQESSWHHNTTRSVNYEAVSGGQDEQYKPSWQGPPKRKLKPPSAEYLATPLSDNPLGLIGMTPVDNYDTSQGTYVAPVAHHRVSRQHATSRYTSSPAVRDSSTSRVSGQHARQRRGWDTYSVNPQHLENTRSLRRGASKASQEYTSSYDRHLPTARFRSATADSPPYHATTPDN